MVINTVTKLNLKIKEESEDVNMCQAIDEMMEDSRLLGKTEGRTEGRISSLKILMESMGLSPQQAMQALKFTKEEQEKYRVLSD